MKLNLLAGIAVLTLTTIARGVATAPIRRDVEAATTYPPGVCAVVVIWNANDPYHPASEYESPADQALFCKWQQPIVFQRLGID